MPAKPIPFPLFQSRLLTLYQPPLRAKATFYGMRQVLAEFAALPGVASTADLTTHRVAEYVAGRGGANVNTTISHLRYLKTASLFAAAEGWVDRPPQWRRLMPRAAPPARKRHHAHGQVVALLEHLRRGASDWRSRRLYALTATVAYTGLRRNEALFLQRGDVHLDRALILVVPRRRLKTEGAAAPVPVPGELGGVLAAWLPDAGDPWLFPGVTRKGAWSGGAPGYRPADWLRRAGEAVGLPDVTWHSLRHTLGKLMVARFDMTADQAKSVLRHRDVRTTEEFYLHRDDVDCLVRSVRRVTFRPGDDPGAGVLLPAAG